MSTKARSINIFLLDGEPDGIRTAQIAMSTIIGVAFKDVQLGRVRNAFSGLIDRPGVYVLTGVNANGKLAAYIGQSENVSDRIQHWYSKNSESTSLEWTEAIAFVSKDETLTASHARFVEAELIQAAQGNPHWDVPNKQRPSSDGKLPKPDEFAMREFVDQAKTLAGALGCSIFKAVSSKSKQSGLFDAAQPATAPEFSPAFKMAGTGYDASAVVSLTTGDFVVQKGSTIKSQPAPSMPKGALKIRETLLTDGVLQVNDGAVSFTQDYSFSSSSTAACVVCGGSISGNAAWKFMDDAGITYGAWKAGQQ